jgi:hypothetical protein
MVSRNDRHFSSGALKLSIRQNYPSAPKTIVVTVPIARDDLVRVEQVSRRFGQRREALSEKRPQP